MATIEAVFTEGHTRAFTKSVYQYDKGVKLKFVGVNLPSEYEVQFSNHENGDVALGAEADFEGVTIPDGFLQSGNYIYAWIYVEDHQNGSTNYMVTIPVIRRPAMISIPDAAGRTPTGYRITGDDNETLEFTTDLSQVISSMEGTING